MTAKLRGPGILATTLYSGSLVTVLAGVLGGVAVFVIGLADPSRSEQMGMHAWIIIKKNKGLQTLFYTCPRRRSADMCFHQRDNLAQWDKDYR